MRRKKIKFSPKLQSSSLDDIKRFVPKDALNTPVISSYNNLPTSYQNGGLPKYQMAGVVPDSPNKTDFFSEEEKKAIIKDKVGEGGKVNPIISNGQNVGALQRALNNIYPDLMKELG